MLPESAWKSKENINLGCNFWTDYLRKILTCLKKKNKKNDNKIVKVIK
jgi:hypothetical protein